MASVSIALIGQPSLSLVLLFAVVFISGWCISGSQPAVNTLAATYYPTDLRSTGIGAGLGVGRVGAIVGPVLGGFALGHQWSGHAIYLAAAVPCNFRSSDVQLANADAARRSRIARELAQPSRDGRHHRDRAHDPR